MKNALVGLGLFVVLAPALPSFGHERTDWRTDRRAFASAHAGLAPLEAAPYQGAIPGFHEEIERAPELRSEALRAQLTRYLEVSPNRGTVAGKNAARAWLTDLFMQAGFAVTQHQYPGTFGGAGGINLIAERVGTTGKTVILSSHLDSVNNGGANDDGIGNIVSLALAAAVARTSFAHTFRIVLFDQEENGLVGSKKYVASLVATDKRAIMGAIHLEMMATNSRNDGAFHVIDCDRAESVFISRAILGAIAPSALALSNVRACTDRSDHDSFWKAGIPAVVLSENFFGGDGDRCYHKACDIVDARLNLDYASRIARAVGHALGEL